MPPLKSQFVFYETDLPGMATHCPQAQCGFSLYKNVLVQWDEDHDERIFAILDEMDLQLLDRLLVVQEHKGSVAMIWSNSVPAEFAEGQELFVGGDVWYVVQSNTSIGPPLPTQQRHGPEEDIPF
jgi:hypothetical protein